MSSPNVNYVICTSSLFIYISTVLFGIDSVTSLDDVKFKQTVSHVCMVRMNFGRWLRHKTWQTLVELNVLHVCMVNMLLGVDSVTSLGEF